MNTPSTNPPRRRRRVGLALLATATVAALLLATYLGAGTSRPGTSPGRSAGTSGGTAPAGGPLPISTGGVVQPSILPGQTLVPGQSPTIAADTVPLTRPMFEFTGSRPWQIQALPSSSTALEGYASRPSYLPGDTLRLAVSTTAPTYDLTIWRVSGAAPVDSPFVRVASAGNLPGRIQPAPTVDPTTRMVAARWPPTYSFPIPSWWQSGVYLVRLDSSEHVQSYIPFVLRSPSAHAVLVVSNALTWQAYNDWGGSSVYQTSVGEPAAGVRRALGVSFDRPYANEDGAGQLFTYELPLISWLERQGLDVSFTTDYDLSLAPDSAPLPRVVVFNGHSEYWGAPLYDWIDRHLTGGDIGVAMLAADSAYWPVSFGPGSPDGPRDFVCLKDGPVPQALLPPGQTPDPSEAAAATPPPGDIEERSGSGFQSYGPAGPYTGSFPGEPLFGVRYRGITSVLGRYSIDPAGADPRLLDGTGLAANGSLGFIAGGEVDGVYPFAEWWGPLGGVYDHRLATAGQVPGRESAWRWTADAVWRELPSGGRVFSAGTFYWGWALDPAWGSQHHVPPGFGRLTLNILHFLGAA
jgi:hypothetical protein